MGVGEIDPEGSGTLSETAKPGSKCRARSRGINPDSQTKRVDNSGSATTFFRNKIPL